MQQLKNCDSEEADGTSIDGENSMTMSSVDWSDEFEDDDGCPFRISSMALIHVNARCLYPRHANLMHRREKLFDLALTKELIKQRNNG
jgi:hypothetical protein